MEEGRGRQAGEERKERTESADGKRTPLCLLTRPQRDPVPLRREQHGLTKDERKERPDEEDSKEKEKGKKGGEGCG